MREILFLVMAKSTFSIPFNSYFLQIAVGKRLCKNLQLKSISFKLVVQVFAS